MLPIRLHHASIEAIARRVVELMQEPSPSIVAHVSTDFDGEATVSLGMSETATPEPVAEPPRKRRKRGSE